MRFGKILAAAAALSLTASPVLAQSASSLSLSGARVGASMEEGNELEGGFIIPLLAVAAVILAVVVIADGGDDAPTSP